MFLDDTACNLASLNFLAFRDPQTRLFDLDGYEHATRLWTIVLEISVLMAQFAAVDDGRVAMLSMAFIAFRILHGIFYVTGTQAMRSLVWLGGFACVAALMVSSALNLAP